MTGDQTISQAVVETLHAYGVQRIFGVPGGGSSLQVIDAAARCGIDFILARAETPAIIMAAVTGELSGVPGVALTTKGPGIANGVNGLAYASLDRAPMVVLSDGFDEQGLTYQSHQVIDQQAMVAPITKARSYMRGADVAAEVTELLDVAMTHPRGPVYIEFTSAQGKKPVRRTSLGSRTPPASNPPAADSIAWAAERLASKKRPILLPGLQVIRDPAAAAAFVDLAEALQCPIYPTYKAKGVMPDDHPLVAGLYVGGAGEAPFIEKADLIVLVGADPVEFALQPWRYPDTCVIDLTLHPYDRQYMEPQVTVVGDLWTTLTELARQVAPGQWEPAEIVHMRNELSDKLRVHGDRSINPQHVIDAAVRVAPEDARATVDAGAHMLPTMAFWKARRPNDVLISNGLATMAFALPAAIAAALHEPSRPVVAFTGDGGLAMCLGELATAAQCGADITVIVFNDSALSLIGVKQSRDGYHSPGVEFNETDFATTARGLGCLGLRCDDPSTLGAAITRGVTHKGPAVIDVVVDPHGYHDQVKSLRG